ncbi:hypothetical protein PPSIR1_15425 [Plesiocystis pacifica SIR-1]|uniref:Lipoprotein n=1 Tax=Plesiocystis pacifica SIR-1 TaxID=391625 RepID=A6GK52_9BACT|nr:hypothetical protein [Plesiocystis pacifica]EDM73751.1 hypothetical protein PPSIR1_15425 [Plesiocystis pacifica SIR-1]
MGAAARSFVIWALSLGLGGGALVACGPPSADGPTEDIDFEALREEACAAACSTMDACEPDRFEGQEPEDCFTRCTSLLPLLHEENQCGSRQIIWLECLGELSCEAYAAYDANEKLPRTDHDYSIPCIAEDDWKFPCDEDAPFDLEEPVSTP